MLINEWLKGAQRAGWRVSGINAKALHLKCEKHGCSGSKSLPLDNLGPTPAECDLPHVGQYSKNAFDTYEALIGELRRRRRELGLDQGDLSNAMGVADGYVNKLESFKKVASPPTLLLWAQSLGLTITTAPSKLPAATLRAIEQRAAKPYAPNQARFKHDR